MRGEQAPAEGPCSGLRERGLRGPRGRLLVIAPKRKTNLDGERAEGWKTTTGCFSREAVNQLRNSVLDKAAATKGGNLERRRSGERGGPAITVSGGVGPRSSQE